MPYCSNCGTEMAEQAVSCPSCGHPAPRARPAAGARRTEGTAVASLVLGIAGFIICPLIPSILAIVFGNQAQRKIGQDPSLEGDGMAKAGVILGWIGVGLAALGILIVILVAASGGFATPPQRFEDFDIGLRALGWS